MTDTYTPVLTDEQILAIGAFGQSPLKRLAHGRAIERATIEAYQRQQWRPIETAPKDGTLILMRSVHGRIADGFIDRLGPLSWPYIRIEPTHWMPLPPAPETQS